MSKSPPARWANVPRDWNQPRSHSPRAFRPRDRRRTPDDAAAGDIILRSVLTATPSMRPLAPSDVRAMCADGQEPASFGILNSVQSVLVAMRKSTIRSGTKSLEAVASGASQELVIYRAGSPQDRQPCRCKTTYSCQRSAPGSPGRLQDRTRSPQLAYLRQGCRAAE
jgi:hypothetical protein